MTDLEKRYLRNAAFIVQSKKTGKKFTIKGKAARMLVRESAKAVTSLILHGK